MCLLSIVISGVVVTHMGTGMDTPSCQRKLKYSRLQKCDVMMSHK